jgi:hypothetical protein
MLDDPAGFGRLNDLVRLAVNAGGWGTRLC